MERRHEHRHRHKRSRSRDKRNSRSSHRSQECQERRDRSRNDQRDFKFDSPPREYIEYTQKVWDVYSSGANTQEDFINKIQQMASIVPSSQANKIDRELYIGNLPSGMTIQQLTDILNSTLKKMNLVCGPGDPILTTWISNDGHYAFIEFRSIEEAKMGYELNNVQILGQPLKVGQPKTYAGNQPPTVTGLQALSSSAIGLNKASDEMVSKILGGKGKLIVTGLPHGLLEEEINVLLEEHGELKCFDMPKDPITGLTRGYAVFDYQSKTSMASALKQASFRVSGVIAQVSKVGKESLAQALLPPAPDFDNKAKFTSRVLVLKNMVKITDLENDEDYEEIHDDVLEECKKYGRVISIIIPRSGEHTSGIGKIFVEFPTVEEATRARTGLEGMEFNEKRVECGFHPEELFFQGNFVGE